MIRPEVRELEYFLAVAETLHFARAAEQLGIAPPPLSRAIAQLERRLGVVLFERTSRRVELTRAGREFRTEARTALRALDRAVQRAQQAGPGPLRIATPPGTGAGLLRELVRACITRFGPGSVELVFTREQTAAVREGHAEVALVCSADDLSDLDTQAIAIETPVVLVPAGHPFANRKSVARATVQRERTYTSEVPPLGLDALIDLVATGSLTVVVGNSAADRLGRHVVAVPVTGLPDRDVLLAWPENSHDPRIGALLDLNRRLYKPPKMA